MLLLLVIGWKPLIAVAQNGQGWKVENRPATVSHPFRMVPIVHVPLRVREVLRNIIVMARPAWVRRAGLPAGVGWALIEVRRVLVGANNLNGSQT